MFEGIQLVENVMVWKPQLTWADETTPESNITFKLFVLSKYSIKLHDGICLSQSQQGVWGYETPWRRLGANWSGLCGSSRSCDCNTIVRWSESESEIFLYRTLTCLVPDKQNNFVMLYCPPSIFHFVLQSFIQTKWLTLPLLWILFTLKPLDTRPVFTCDTFWLFSVVPRRGNVLQPVSWDILISCYTLP